MRWIGLDSSLLAATRYFREQRWLEIKFRQGSTYRYLGVPGEIFDEFLAAPSKGAYFQRRIRDHFLFVIPSKDPSKAKRQAP